MSSDPRPLFFHALDQTGGLVHGVAADDLERPTPCGEYDVSTLLGHLISVLRRITHVAGGGDANDIARVSTDIAADEWGATWDRERALLEPAWADDAVLDTVLSLPFGRRPGRAAVAAYTVEVTTHGWDLATATGQTGLDDELAAAALVIAQKFIPAEPRGGPVPFAAPTPVPAGAGPYQELAAWMGRSA